MSGEEEFVALNEEGTRRVAISGYRGVKYVAIREYYADDKGVMKPGKKGLNLTIDEWLTLKQEIPRVTASLAAFSQPAKTIGDDL